MQGTSRSTLETADVIVCVAIVVFVVIAVVVVLDAGSVAFLHETGSPASFPIVALRL